MQNEKVKVAVLGAGPAGLTFAYQLLKKGIRADVYEAAAHTGGLSCSPEIFGKKVDLGPHAFYNNSYPQALALWKEINGTHYESSIPAKFVLYKGRMLRYPFQPLDFLRKACFPDFMRAAVGFLFRRRKRSGAPANAQELIVDRFGKGFYRLFFAPYCEKYCGIAAEEMDAAFAAALFGIREKNIRTNAPAFLMPVNGTGQTWELLTQKLEEKGIAIFTNTRISKIIPGPESIKTVQTGSDEIREYEMLVSCIPLQPLLKMLPAVPQKITQAAQELVSRHTLLVYFKVSRTFPFHYLSSYSNEFRFGRITNYAAWLPRKWKDETQAILSVEYWCDERSPEWNMEEQKLIAFAQKEMEQAVFLSASEVLDATVIRLPNAYPVLKKGYRENVKQIGDFLAGIKGLEVLGRHGNFKWDGQEDNLLAGINLAEALARKSGK